MQWLITRQNLADSSRSKLHTASSKIFVLNWANFDILVREPARGPNFGNCLDMFPRLAKGDYSQTYAVDFPQFTTEILRDIILTGQCFSFSPRSDPICRSLGSFVRAFETTIDRRKHLSQRPFPSCFSRDNGEKVNEFHDRDDPCWRSWHSPLCARPSVQQGLVCSHARFTVWDHFVLM